MVSTLWTAMSVKQIIIGPKNISLSISISYKKPQEQNMSWISPFVSWSFFYCGKYSWEDNIKIGQTSTVLPMCLVFFKMSCSILLALAAGPKTVWAIYRSIIIICVGYQTVSHATYRCRVEINPWWQGHTLLSEGFPKPKQHLCS